MNWIYVNHGDEAFYQAQKEVMDPGLQELLRAYEKADFKRRVQMMTMGLVGYPIFVTLPADKMARESCRYCFYKDPEDIPEEIYKRVEKEKP